MLAIAKRTSTLIERVRLAAWTEREVLVPIAFGLATAAWTAAVSRNSALEPLVTIPVLATARYRDRRLGAVAIITASILGATLARVGSLEMAVWHAFVLGVSLSALFWLAERHTAPAKPENDAIANFLARTSRAATTDLAIVVDCDGFEELDARYGEEARDHVTALLRRTLEAESTSRDLVARTGNHEFVLVLQGTDLEGAHEVLARVRHSFRQAVRDAGYECSISVAYSQIERDQETIPNLMRQAEVQFPRMEAQGYVAFLN